MWLVSDCTRIQTWVQRVVFPASESAGQVDLCSVSYSPFLKRVNLEVRRVSQAVQGGSRLAGMAASAGWPGVCWVMDGHCSEVRQCR